MTRLFSDGAELGDSLFWTLANCTVVGSSPTPRSGNYCYKLTSGSWLSRDIPAISEGFMRFGYYTSVWRAAVDGYVVAFKNSVTTHFSISFASSSDGHLTLIGPAGTVIATGITSLTRNAWHLIEIHFIIHDSSGVVLLKMDGVQEIKYEGDTRNGATTTVTNFGHYLNAVTMTTAVDDLAMNDTSNANGLGDISWCGDGHYDYIAPNADGSVNDWTGSDNNQVSNYLLVDDIPSNSDTDYVAANGATAGLQDMYNLASYSLTGKSVTRLFAEARARKAQSLPRSLVLGVRTPNGLEEKCDAVSLSMLYTRIVGDDLITNPDDENAWDEGDIGRLQAIIEVG